MANEPVTLEFLGRQMERLQDRFGSMEDQMTVLTGIVMRMDSTIRGLVGALDGLATEVRGLYRLSDRLERRVRKLEDQEEQ
jgi:hypothetical protein